MSDSPTYRCLIVDDEKNSREVLENYLTKYCPQMEICGKAANVEEAIGLIGKLRPEVLFLDIEMPFKSGFDLLDEFDELEFEVIFVTAYGEYALNAIQVSAADYLLKPLNIDELVGAVDKVVERLNGHQDVNRAKILLDNLKLSEHQKQKVVLPLLDGFEVVVADQIIRCEADDNFTRFYLDNGEKKLICRPLKFYESALGEIGFMRVHKSHMVNLNFVTRYRKGKGGMIVLKDESEVPLSVSRKADFLNAFSG